MKKPASHSDIISLWPTVAELATAIDEKPDTVRRWRLRSSIPPWKWYAVEDAAKTASIRGVSFAVLSRLAPKKYQRASAA